MAKKKTQKKMQKTQTLIIFVVVLVVLVTIFALWKLLGEKDADNIENSSQTSVETKEALIDLAASEVKSISIKNQKTDMTLQKTVANNSTSNSTTTENSTDSKNNSTDKSKYDWLLLNQKFSRIDPDKVTRLGNDLLKISIIDEINVSEGSNLDIYGINSPQATVTYDLESGDRIELLLGNNASASGKDHYYAYNEKSKRLGLISVAAEKMLSDELDLLSTKIFDFKLEDLQQLLIQRSQDEYNLSMTAEPVKKSDTGEFQALTWTINEPISWQANDANVNQLANELLAIEANSYTEITEDTDLNQYGLSEPTYEISLKSADQTKTILIGSSSGENSYAMLKGENLLFDFTTSSLSNIGSPQLDYFSPFVSLVHIENVDTLKLTSKDKEYISRVYYPTTKENDYAENNGYEKPEAVYTLNGRYANIKNDKDDNLFTKYYQSLIGISINGMDLAARNVESKEAEFTLEYIMRNPEMADVKLDFIPRADNTFYVVKNGVYTGFYCKTDAFYTKDNIDSPGVLYAIELLEDGMQKQDTFMVDDAKFTELKQLVPKPASETSESSASAAGTAETKNG